MLMLLILMFMRREMIILVEIDLVCVIWSRVWLSSFFFCVFFNAFTKSPICLLLVRFRKISSNMFDVLLGTAKLWNLKDGIVVLLFLLAFTDLDNGLGRMEICG